MRNAFSALLIYLALPLALHMANAAIAGERMETVREERTNVGEYQFVTEQRVLYEDGVVYNDLNLPTGFETFLIGENHNRFLAGGPSRQRPRIRVFNYVTAEGGDQEQVKDELIEQRGDQRPGERGPRQRPRRRRPRI